jgi:RND family efflux transporter MFP subunit
MAVGASIVSVLICYHGADITPKDACAAMVVFRPRYLPIVVLALLAAGCHSKPPADADKPAGKETTSAASLAVSLARVEQRTIDRSVIASGPVSAWQEMQLGVELSGVRVTALNVDVGQQVSKGQVLLELDHRTLDMELRQAQAALSEADAGVQLAKVNLSRSEALVARQLVSASSIDQLRAAVVQSQARVSTTRAQRDNAQLRRDFAALRAPNDGIISKRMVQPGQVVAAGVELLRMIRDGRLEWRAELSENDLALVIIGAKVALTGADGTIVEGSVRATSPGVDVSTRTGTVYADLPSPGALKVGTFVEGRIVSSQAAALLVPAAAVVRRDGYPYVFTVDANNVVKRLRVRTGSTAGDHLELIDGVKVGDAVVVRGAGFLSDGDHVRVVADNH